MSWSNNPNPNQGSSYDQNLLFGAPRAPAQLWVCAQPHLLDFLCTADTSTCPFLTHGSVLYRKATMSVCSKAVGARSMSRVRRARQRLHHTLYHLPQYIKALKCLQWQRRVQRNSSWLMPRNLALDSGTIGRAPLSSSFLLSLSPPWWAE
ncbi:hypothetical protein PISMIDRAFT_476554 [Pisolithus microcarpus 441]|uniref:Uncharacterized protein n=1 Tax=Pisolithus microcarpus 441 TaxID=765257 RepID=A0A0C9XHA7_9AGAM|nr:hypothetical protein PISMIDRAFT_476554 [Pisolithus microcarpus 441]